MTGIRLVLGWSLVAAACSFDVDHRFPDGDPSVRVGLDVECAACWPYCGASGVPYCEDSEGLRCDGCRVGCRVGKRLDCSAPPDVTCWNDGPTGPVDVPVTCVPDPAP